MRSPYQFVLLIILACSCITSKKEILETPQHTNALIHESSPYLHQHAHNPVDWNAWNEKTLQKSKETNKLMIVSIGYAACHWCHVMERESFEDSTVAAVMNKNFISVKIDREERPDIDQIYINAVQLMTGRAGWPLNVITLPDGRPVWGGTYFNKEQWIEALEKIQEVYEKEPQKLLEYASHLEEGIKNMDLITLNTSEIDFSAYPMQNLIEKWSQSFDGQYGGTKRAPKFMMPNNYQFLLRYAVENDDTKLLDHVTLTLDKMAYGGLYDHVGGGFSRYSVDEKWHVPHFEKMLYDNAQLVSLYSDAYLATKRPLYKEVVEESLAFISREMTTANGAFYSSLDADSLTESGELEEGAYYVYTKEELELLLEDDFALFKAYYNVNSFGKWEGNNYVLIRKSNDQDIVEEFSITLENLQNKKKEWKTLLLAYRNKRPKPRLDDKTLTSWNGLMLKGYVDAYKAFQKTEYLEAAERNAHFLISTQIDESGALFHNYKDEKSSINGYLEDYATVIEAFISLYEVTINDKWLRISKELTDEVYTNFWDSESGMFYFTSTEDPALLTRNFEYRDNVIAASNSIMAKNLYKLGHYFDEAKYQNSALQMLKNVEPEIEKYPNAFSNWLDLLENYRTKYYEIVVVGEKASEKINTINQFYFPNKLIAGSKTKSESALLKARYVEGETLIYVCVNNTCKMPVSTVSEALKSIE